MTTTNELKQKPRSGLSDLTAGLAPMSLEHAVERLLAMEGAVQRLMVIVAVSLPHTDPHISATNSEWAKIIKDIERDHKGGQRAS